MNKIAARFLERLAIFVFRKFSQMIPALLPFTVASQLQSPKLCHKFRRARQYKKSARAGIDVA
jgi:hypothetical protein